MDRNGLQKRINIDEVKDTFRPTVKHGEVIKIEEQYLSWPTLYNYI